MNIIGSHVFINSMDEAHVNPESNRLLIKADLLMNNHNGNAAVMLNTATTNNTRLNATAKKSSRRQFFSFVVCSALNPGFLTQVVASLGTKKGSRT